MTDDLIVSIASFILYGVATGALLYIGKVLPAYRLELVGIILVVSSRVLLYIIAIGSYSGIESAPSTHGLTWISRMSSLLAAIIINVYAFIEIKKHRRRRNE